MLHVFIIYMSVTCSPLFWGTTPSLHSFQCIFCINSNFTSKLKCCSTHFLQSAWIYPFVVNLTYSPDLCFQVEKDTISSSLGVLYNIAKAKNGDSVFGGEDLSVLLPYKEGNDEYLKAMSAMTFAFLSDEKTEGIQREKGTLQVRHFRLQERNFVMIYPGSILFSCSVQYILQHLNLNINYHLLYLFPCLNYCLCWSYVPQNYPKLVEPWIMNRWMQTNMKCYRGDDNDNGWRDANNEDDVSYVLVMTVIRIILVMKKIMTTITIKGITVMSIVMMATMMMMTIVMKTMVMRMAMRDVMVIIIPPLRWQWRWWWLMKKLMILVSMKIGM